MEREKFCSTNSVKINESLFGTAAFFRNILLIEYGMAFGAKAVDDSQIDIVVKSYLKECLNRQIFDRILLIRNKRTISGLINVYAVSNEERSPFIRHYVLKNYFEITQIDFAKWEGRVLSSPLYLVCTNGKKDKCCSKFGLPVYNSLEKLDENVWQCSHIGGDRFAPNIIVMPYGHFYGHLPVEETDDFYSTTQKKDIYFSCFRGRSRYGFRVQAAFNFLRKKLNDFGNFNFKLIGNTLLSGGTEEVSILHRPTGLRYRIKVNSQKSEEKYFLTCKATKPSSLNILSLLSIEEI